MLIIMVIDDNWTYLETCEAAPATPAMNSIVTHRCQWFVSQHLAFCSFNFRVALSLAAWR